jgi:hypothetical protein
MMVARGTLCFAVAAGIASAVGVRSRSQIEGVVVRDLSWSERDRVVAYALRVSNRTTDEMTVTIDLVAVQAKAEQREARPDLGRVQLALVLGPAEEKTYYGLLPLVDSGSSELTISKHCVRHEQRPVACTNRPTGPRSSS